MATATVLFVAASTATGPKAATNGSLVNGLLTPTQGQLFKGGTGTLTGAPSASTIQTGLPDELDPATLGDADAGLGGNADDDNGGSSRTLPGVVKGHGHLISSSARAKSNPGLGTNWQGLNLHDQRFANGGNQFTVEPPDQGLCAGNGFVMEAVNDVVQVYNTSGQALLNGGNAVDLNTFYGYPAAINRTTGADGPSITDPTCIYDAGVTGSSWSSSPSIVWEPRPRSRARTTSTSR